jgi:hypothetical protein
MDLDPRLVDAWIAMEMDCEGDGLCPMLHPVPTRRIGPIRGLRLPQSCVKSVGPDPEIDNHWDKNNQQENHQP